VENSLIESILKVCKILNMHSVKYLVVGGTAVAFHRLVSKVIDVDVPYIGYDDLIKSKTTLARPKDIEDMKQLKSRKNNNE
jgi:predicted nucleotidyltransferase